MDTEPLDRALRNTHRAVLVSLGLCAAISALQTSAPEPPPPEPFYTTVGIALAVATILLRTAGTSRVAGVRTRVFLTLAAYACAVGLGVVGSALAMTRGDVRSGIVFALAGALFCLRPPAPLGTERR